MPYCASTHMERLCVQLHNPLVLGPRVSWDDHKPRGEAGVVVHGATERAPPHQHFSNCPPVSAHEGGHVHDVVVGKEKKVMGIVEALNGVELVLVEIPTLVKLIECQKRFVAGNTRA